VIRYPLNYNPIEEYWTKIKSGEEVVSIKVRETYEKLHNDLTYKNTEWYYSHKRANHIIEFFENYCRHSKGKMGGKPVVLELWEKALLAASFGFIDINGNRKYREVFLVVGKKNGKSLIASGIGLYLQVADNEPGAEVYAVANTREQAKIIWTEAKRMVRKSPTLRKRIKGLVGELKSDFNDGTFKPLASDSDNLDGLNVHGGLMDEIHQWKNGKPLFDIVADGTSAREQPFIFITSTAGVIREDIYDEKYAQAEKVILGYKDGVMVNERFLAFIYEIDKRSEWTDEKCWKKANPGLGTIKNLVTLQEKVEQAKLNPALVKNLVCKEFNIRETSSQAWLGFDTLNNTATYDIATMPMRYAIGGLDLSETTDLTCGTFLFRLPNDPMLYVHQMYWLPADKLEDRIKFDQIPYDKWYEQGLLRLSEGNKINYKEVVAWFVEVQEKYGLYVYKIGYDSWNSQYIIDELKANFGENSVEPVIQGKKTMSSPMKNIEADLEAKRINYNNNPILKWCLSNSAIDVDKNDNISLIKTSNPKRRIDGTASLIDAFVVYERNYEDYINMI
jgi:phage terminase large subunit-like protein